MLAILARTPIAAIGCVVWEPDGDEIVATSMSFAAARDRYRWA